MTCPPGLTPFTNTRPTQPIKKHKPRDIKLNTVLSDYRGKLGEIIDNLDILKLNSVGWEDVRNYPSLKIAVGTISPHQRTLLISSQVNVTADLTIPSNISLWFLQNGSLNISSGKTVTINGHVNAGLYQIFTGSGGVLFGYESVEDVWVIWFVNNAVPGTTDTTVQVQKALTASVPIGGANLHFTAPYPYATTGQLLIDQFDPPNGNPVRLNLLAHSDINGGTGIQHTLRCIDNFVGAMIMVHSLQCSHWEGISLWGSAMCTEGLTLESDIDSPPGTNPGYHWGIYNNVFDDLIIQHCTDAGVTIRGQSVGNQEQADSNIFNNPQINNCLANFLQTSGNTQSTMIFSPRFGMIPDSSKDTDYNIKVTSGSTYVFGGTYEGANIADFGLLGASQGFQVYGGYSETNTTALDCSLGVNHSAPIILSGFQQHSMLVTSLLTDATNATPIVITEVAHRRADNDHITIAGVVGNTAANGTWKITYINANSYSLDSSVGNGAYVSGGTVVASDGNSYGDGEDKAVKISTGIRGGGQYLITGCYFALGNIHVYDGYSDVTVQATRLKSGKVVRATSLSAVTVIGSNTKHNLGTLTDATNATPIVITEATHVRAEGDIVTIAGVVGNTAANGTWRITIVDVHTYSLDNSIGNGAYSSGGAVVATEPNLSIGAWNNVPYDPTDFTTDGAGGWTVEEGDVDFFRWSMSGQRMMTVSFQLGGTSVLDAPGGTLRILIPNGEVAGSSLAFGVLVYYDGGGAWTVGGLCETTPLTDKILLTKTAAASNWTVSGDLTYVRGSITFEIR